MKALRSMIAGLGIAGSSGLAPASPGGATRLLLDSISRTVLAAAATWQVVMLLITLAVLGREGWPLSGLQLLLGVLAVLSIREQRLRPVLPAAMALAGVLGYVMSGDADSSLTFAACWQINMSGCLAGFLILRRYAIWLVLATALCASAAVALQLPSWGLQIPVSIVVTQSLIIVVIRLGLSVLLRRSTAIDASIRTADDASLRYESLKHRSTGLAEDARVLHDTAINTFAAIASGSSEAARVRAQCARDVELLETLRGARRKPAAHLREVFEQPGLPTRRHGANDEELARSSAALPQRTVAAIVGCVREAVTNATKHSGADHVDIEVTTTGAELLIRVGDDGIGFDGEASSRRGVDASIRRRADDHGFRAEVRSRPGEGTVVALTVPVPTDGHETEERPEDRAFTAAAATFHRLTGDYWGLGVTIVSIVLTVTDSRNEAHALFPMILVMLVALLLTRAPLLRRDRALLPIMLTIATVLVFLLSALATSFGTAGATLWQALAPTGPFVLLLSTTRRRAWPIAAAAVWAAVVVSTAATVLPNSATGAAITLIAGIVGLGFSCVWVLFQGVVTRLSDLEAESRRTEFEARLSSRLEAASQESYRRWMDAGIDLAETLLRSVRDGSLSPRAASTRAACDEEERYLRQLVQIGPELVHLGAELMPTLRRARDLGVSFRLRIGDRDAADERTAREIGEIIAENLVATGTGGSLSASLFPVDGGLQLTLAGSALRAPSRTAGSTHLLTLGGTELLEITFRTGQIERRGSDGPRTTARNPITEEAGRSL